MFPSDPISFRSGSRLGIVRPADFPCRVKECLSGRLPTDSILEATDSILEATDSILEATDSILEATDSISAPTDSILEATDSILEATDSILEATDSILEATDSILEATDSILEATDSFMMNLPHRSTALGVTRNTLCSFLQAGTAQEVDVPLNLVIFKKVKKHTHYMNVHTMCEHGREACGHPHIPQCIHYGQQTVERRGHEHVADRIECHRVHIGQKEGNTLGVQPM